MNLENVKNMVYITQLMCDLTLSMLEEQEIEIKEKEEVCQHKNKLNLTVMGGPEKWNCKDCGFEYEEEKVEINKG